MPDQALSKSRRRWLRTSVRGLIVLVLVIGAGLGWIVRSAKIQREAVAAITTAGGWVKYDWEWSNRKSISGGKPWAPRWLVDLVGVDYFGHVTAVGLPGAPVATIAQVGHLTRLQNFAIYSSSNPYAEPNLNDAGLAELKGMSDLALLGLGFTHVTDAGLTHLKALTSLASLDLGFTQVSDAGLAHLKELKNLTGLNLIRTRVTDAGLAHLKGLNNLSSLRLTHTQITDAGLAHLMSLTKLSVLDLSGTHVTDAGVEQLKQALPNLKITR